MAEYVRSVSEGGNVQVSARKMSTANEVYKVGELLKMAAGKVTKAGATDKPEFVCGEEVAVSTASKKVLVFPILATHEFKGVATADMSAVNEGDKVTISVDGMNPTATTASGVLTVVRKTGNTVGSAVYFKV